MATPSEIETYAVLESISNTLDSILDELRLIRELLEKGEKGNGK